MSDSTTPTPRDFDAWVTLASSDPEAFERQRSQIIRRAIGRAPVRRQLRLQRLQWQLDQIRATSRTPMVACLRMQRMLWQSIDGEDGLLACLRQPATILRRRSQPDAASARVIPFRPEDTPG